MDAGECLIVQYEIDIDDPKDYLRKIHETGSRFGTTIILFNAELMAGRAHVCAALQHAFRAFREGYSISNSPEMEALLYASASRQCHLGVRFGVHQGKNSAYLCLCPESLPALDLLLTEGALIEDDWDVFSPEKVHRLMDVFGVTSRELGVAGNRNISDLVLERVALLEVQR